MEPISVSQLNKNKNAHSGKRVAVMGKIHVLALSGLRPCQDGQPCPKYDDALLALVDLQAGTVVTEEGLVRLYRRSAENARPEQIHCRIIDENKPTFDCPGFLNGTVATVEGLFTKEQIPDQFVGDSTGRLEVVKFRDAYYLVIDS